MKIKQKHRTILLYFLLISFLILSFAIPAFARPGGGHSYSGGGGGGGGDLIGLIIYLIFYLLPPYISIPLIIIIFIVYNIAKKRMQTNENAQLVSNPTVSNISYSVAVIENKIEQLKSIDPNFSRILFVDFIHLLYVKYYSFQNDKKLLETIRPFFSESIIESVQGNSNSSISEIVIGNLTIADITFLDEKVNITVEINANYTAVRAGHPVRYIVTERWLLERSKDVISPEPEKMHVLSCPNCGAPAKFNDAGYCEYCGTLIVPGKQQWFVKSKTITYVETLQTKALLTYTQEIGTNYPTIYSPNVEHQKQMFASMHNTTWEQYWSVLYHKVASRYFMEIYKNWSDLTWEKVRHLLTDRLWESYNFWINEYKRNGLRNKLDDTQIEKMHVAKIEIDKFYEAITLRIFARTKDYVVDKNGKVLAGNPKNARYFSEYWTFVRRSGVENDDYDMQTCPNCGAPLDKINQNGICEYCGAKITTGDFSWVLASIVQDEEYKG